MKKRFFELLLIGALMALFVVPARSAEEPSAGQPSMPDLMDQATSTIDQARRENLDLLAPRRFEKAMSAYEQACLLFEKKGEEAVLRIKLKSVLDEIADGRKIAERSRQRLAEALAARAAAMAAGTDTLGNSAWSRAEERLRNALRDLEKGDASVDSSAITDIAGGYRVARRDALRGTLFDQARKLLAELDQEKGDRVTPTLALRAHQAMSRAEAAIAQENLEEARASAAECVSHARHALAMVRYVESVEKQKTPWESALLPYDDLLASAAQRLGGPLDFSPGGARTGDQLNALIDARQESLRTEVSHLQDTRRSLETSLADAQEQMAGAMNRISTLEARIATMESERTTSREAQQKSTETADRIARAQAAFTSGEAEVFQDDPGRIVIRLPGLKFSPGATILLRSHQKVIERAAVAVQQFPGASITVEGHTDGEGAEATNQELSQDRAEAAAAYLAKQLNRPQNQIRAAGLGESMPIAPNDTAEGRAKNRRIDIVLSLP